MTIGKRGNWLWLLAYVLTMVYIALELTAVRQETLDSLSTPRAIAQWKAVQGAMRSASASRGVVPHPSRAEPPALELLRDHYPVLFGSALVFGTALFAMLVFAVKGSLWQAPKKNAERKDS